NTTTEVGFMINAPPSIDTVTITPNTGVFDDSTLTCTAIASDPNESLTPTLTWYIGNNTVGIGSTLNLAGLGAVSGTDVVCSASVTDSNGLSATDFDTVTVENRAPMVNAIALSPTTVYTNDTITATPTFSDQDTNQTITGLYEWHVISVLNGSDSMVQSSPTPTLSGTFFNRDDDVYVVVTPNDGIDNGVPLISSSQTIYNTPPTPPSVAISPSPADESEDLECQVTAPSSDADLDSVTYTYLWFVNGSPTSFTSSTISSTETTEGEDWLCLVTPTDGTDQGGGNSATIMITQSDSDGDGVPDADDMCPGFDDNLDSNNNGIPDGCESSIVYSYTGDAQTFVVPSNVEFIHIQAYGAKGGDGHNGVLGGYGGFAEATIPVIPGETLEIYVGGAGSSHNSYGAGGYNGGGSVNECCGSSQLSGTGGGATDVRISPYGLNERMIVAGGGGGGGSSDWGPGPGGGGGGLNGEDGATPISNNGNVANGTGGSQTAGGVAYQCCGSSYPNQNGSFGQGGACWHDSAACGAGGGGWYGGGAGSFAPGGGGSSYIGWPDSTNTNTLSGIQNGNGEVIITYAVP
ncbi:MAG: glycine-rich protein, partial [Myxococcota bacterium]|nr:glycine-rich protein [Myxococcota bacterium]